MQSDDDIFDNNDEIEDDYQTLNQLYDNQNKHQNQNNFDFYFYYDCVMTGLSCVLRSIYVKGLL